MANFSQVLSVPNPNKMPCSVNLEQTSKSSLHARGTSVVTISHLGFMSDRSLPCYVGMRVLPLAEAVILSSAEGSLRSPLLWRWAQEPRHPLGSRALLPHAALWSVFLFSNPHTDFWSNLKFFVVIKSLADLDTLDCAPANVLIKIFRTLSIAQQKFNWVFTRPSVLGWQGSKLGVCVSTNPTKSN